MSTQLADSCLICKANGRSGMGKYTNSPDERSLLHSPPVAKNNSSA